MTRTASASSSPRPAVVEACPGLADQAPVPVDWVGDRPGEGGRPVVEAGRLFPGQLALGGARRTLAPCGRHANVAQDRRLVPVAGQVGQLVVAGSLVGFDGVGDLAVQPHQRGSGDAGLHRVADQRVHELEPARHARGGDEASGHRLVDVLQHVHGRATLCRRHHPGGELPADHRRGAQHVEAARSAGGQADADHVPERVRQVGHVATGGDVPGQLAHEERVAAGERPHPVDDRGAGIGPEQLGDRVPPETAQVHGPPGG
jgi:hypothetical protein